MFQTLGFKKQIQSNWLLVVILFLFALLFGSISIVNHYVFRSNGYDLGIFNHSIYDYSLFRLNKALLMLPQTPHSNILADHFSLVQFIWAPLRYLFGTYTLLIVQTCAILYGGWGVRRFILAISNDEPLSYLAQIHLYVTWGVIAAVGFDYHDNVIAAMLLPHLLLFNLKNNWKAFYFTIAFMLICRVEIAIWTFFIGLAIAIINYRNRAPFKHAIILIFISSFYFILVTQVIIPSISPVGYDQFRYSILGNNMAEALKFALTHPFETFWKIFFNDGASVEDYNLKLQFYLFFLLSGGLFILGRPVFILMLIPIIAQKMLHDSYVKWGISYHYSIETVVVISLACYASLTSIKMKKLKYFLAVFILLLTSATTIYGIKHRLPYWFDTINENFFSAWHYENAFDVGELHKAIKNIPNDAAVSAQANLVSHLAFRDQIYMFPYYNEANYIVLNEKSSVYPITRESFDDYLRKLKNDDDWLLIYDANFTYIFKKKVL